MPEIRFLERRSSPEALAILVILILAILWAAVLLPPILRSRSESGAVSGGIGDFVGKLRSGLGARHGADPSLPPLTPIMGPVGPVGGPMTPGGMPGTPMGPVNVPGSMSPTQRRRRDVLVGLLAAAGFTLLMAVFSGTVMFWVLNLLADALLGGYIFLLLQYKARSAERAPASPSRPVEPERPTNVANIAGRRPRALAGDVTMPSHVEAPREATVLALRRTASW
jgi:hypothetical protein